MSLWCLVLLQGAPDATISQVVDWLVHGTSISVASAAAVLLWRVAGMMKREETLKEDYPPHRHINGSRILYPKEYQPSAIEDLEPHP